MKDNTKVDENYVHLVSSKEASQFKEEFGSGFKKKKEKKN